MDAIVRRLMENHRVSEASYKSGDRYYGGLPSEPSESEYGQAMTQMYNREKKFIEDNGIKKTKVPNGYSYSGSYNGHTFTYVEKHSSWSVSMRIDSLTIDGKEVDTYKSKGLYASIMSIKRVLDGEDADKIVFKDGTTGLSTPEDVDYDSMTLDQLMKVKVTMDNVGDVVWNVASLTGEGYPISNDRYICDEGDGDYSLWSGYHGDLLDELTAKQVVDLINGKEIYS